jgi:hypothetical protein
MAKCPVCGSEYDERAYQIVIDELGSFDSIECAEEAMRRQARGRRDLPEELIDVISSARTLPRGARGPIRTDRAS